MGKQISDMQAYKNKEVKITYKGYRDIDQLVIEKLFASETVTSYEVGKDRWYVFEYSPGHYVHYIFSYSVWSVKIKYIISPLPTMTSNPNLPKI